MNKKMRTKKIRNLAICVMMAIIGILILCIVSNLIDFRVFTGYSFDGENNVIASIKIMGIMLLEFGTFSIGVVVLALGVIGSYNYARKLMR